MDDWSVGQARQYLLQNRDDGVRCPCCNRLVKVYHRKLNSGMARVLIAQWLSVGQEWANTAALPEVRRLGTAGREGAKLAHWELLEHDGARREDGGKPNHWRITDFGRLFILNMVPVPSHVWLIDNTRLEFDSSRHLYIKDALGNHFDYDELMRDRL